MGVCKEGGNSGDKIIVVKGVADQSNTDGGKSKQNKNEKVKKIKKRNGNGIRNGNGNDAVSVGTAFADSSNNDYGEGNGSSDSILNHIKKLEEELGIGNGNAKNATPVLITVADLGNNGVRNDNCIVSAATASADSSNNNYGDGNGSSDSILNQIKELEEELGIDDGDANNTNPAGSVASHPDRNVAVNANDTVSAGTVFADSINNNDGEGNGSIYNSSSDSVLDHIMKLEKRVKDLEEETAEVDENTKYPRDCYSFMTLNGPERTGWDVQKFKLFLFGLVVFMLQITFSLLLMLSVVHIDHGTMEENDNPDAGFLANFVPSNSKALVKIAQFVSLSTYVLFPDSSVQDTVKVIQYWPKKQRIEKNDPVGFMKLSCTLRCIQATLAIISVFFLVLTSTSVIEVILDFTVMNFVSGFDNVAFTLCESGVFGPNFKKESEDVVKKDLPLCMQHKYKHFIYWKTMGTIGAVFIFVFAASVALQESNKFWITKTFRVQFQDETELKDYSGCYDITNKHYFRRHVYNSHNTGIGNASFGYCKDDHRWHLFKGNDDDFDPCNNDELAHSLKTEDFDIATSFEQTWVISSDPYKPLYFFTFDVEDDEDLHCDLGLGDGVCDIPLNKPDYQYDNGDCCASTCTHQNCSTAHFTSAFGNSNIYGIGFPNCEGEARGMIPITIELNRISSSYDPEFAVDQSCVFSDSKQDAEWRAKTTVNPSFNLECNGVKVLSIDIEDSMENNTETVWIEDGVDCTLDVGNTTKWFLPGSETDNLLKSWSICDDPIWFINYTIFHGNKSAIDTEQVEILTQHSREKKIANFQIIPECYFRKLKDHVDNASIYIGSSPSTEAIDWLLGDNTGNSECEDEFFIERFALSTMNFAMNGNATLINDKKQCTWPWTTCTSVGQVIKVDLPKKFLTGAVPNEVFLLTNLETLFMCKLIVRIKTE